MKFIGYMSRMGIIIIIIITNYSNIVIIIIIITRVIILIVLTNTTISIIIHSMFALFYSSSPSFSHPSFSLRFALCSLLVYIYFVIITIVVMIIIAHYYETIGTRTASDRLGRRSHSLLKKKLAQLPPCARTFDDGWWMYTQTLALKITLL